MTEQWKQWKPREGLAKRYNVRGIIEDHTGLVILLSEEQHDNRGLRISFGYTAGSYRRIDETLCNELIGQLELLHGTHFYSQWTFFIVHNSNYAKWLNEYSLEISNYMGYTHFSFFTSKSLIDVLATQPPIFSDVNLP